LSDQISYLGIAIANRQQARFLKPNPERKVKSDRSDRKI
jgi:hypothetical protein